MGLLGTAWGKVDWGRFGTEALGGRDGCLGCVFGGWHLVWIWLLRVEGLGEELRRRF